MNETSIAMREGSQGSRRERARVDPFHDHHARILAQAPVQLAVRDVQGDHLDRAALQQTVGEAARWTPRRRGTSDRRGRVPGHRARWPASRPRARRTAARPRPRAPPPDRRAGPASRRAGAPARGAPHPPARRPPRASATRRGRVPPAGCRGGRAAWSRNGTHSHDRPAGSGPVEGEERLRFGRETLQGDGPRAASRQPCPYGQISSVIPVTGSPEGSHGDRPQAVGG